MTTQKNRSTQPNPREVTERRLRSAQAQAGNLVQAIYAIDQKMARLLVKREALMAERIGWVEKAQHYQDMLDGDGKVTAV